MKRFRRVCSLAAGFAVCVGVLGLLSPQVLAVNLDQPLIANVVVGIPSPQVLAADTFTPTTDFTDNGDGTVTHKLTGLTWMRCAMGQTWTGATCSGTASTHTFDQAKALTSSFAGKTDWRLPSPWELGTIVDYDIAYPSGTTINAAIFPATPSSYFWSSSPSGYSSSVAWSVHFSFGYTSFFYRSNGFHVRLVRGGQSFATLATPTADFIDHGDGSVTHKKSNLIWKRCAEGQNWTGSTCSGTASRQSYDQALTLTSNFAGKNDWRLPNVSELQSIVEYGAYAPATNATIFPATPNAYNAFFGSGTPSARDSRNAWYVNFASGHAYDTASSDGYLVRLVRGGQTSAPSSGSGTTGTGADFGTTGTGADSGTTGTGTNSGTTGTGTSTGTPLGEPLSTQVTQALLFEFAEANYSDLFSGTPTSGQYKQYIYRQYPDTGNIVGIDTTNDYVVVYGPYVGNVIVTLGPKNNFLSTINAWESKGKPVTPPGKTGVNGAPETIRVKGLNGGELTVSNNVGDVLSITNDGTYAFATPHSGAARLERIFKQPANQVCQFTALRGDVIDPYSEILITPKVTDIFCHEDPCGSVLSLGNAPAPTGLRVIETTEEAVKLEWQGQPWATDYGVYCATDRNNATEWGNRRDSLGLTNLLRGNLLPDTDYFCAVTSFYSSPANLAHCQSSASTIVSARTQPVCVAPQVLQNGVCVPNCTSSQDLVSGVCVAKCAAGETRQNGICIAQVGCLERYVPDPSRYGWCIADPNNGCGPGKLEWARPDGSLYCGTAAPKQAVTCPLNTVLYNGVCLYRQNLPVGWSPACDAGMENGICYTHNPPPMPTFYGNTGLQMVSGRCVYLVNGYTYAAGNGECDAKANAIGYCGASTQSVMSNGVCVQVCGEGYIRDSYGGCVEKPQPTYTPPTPTYTPPAPTDGRCGADPNCSV